MGIKLTLDEVKYRLKSINPNIEILSKEYINNSTKMKCKCLIDGYVWSASWGKLQQKRGCPECGGNRTDYTIDIVKEKLSSINPNIKILSKEYINSSTKLECQCLLDNHIWDITWGNLQSGKGCPKCRSRKVGQIKRVDLSIKIERLNKLNPNIEVLDENFIDGCSVLKCRCKVDGYVWESLWSNLLNSQGCPACKHRDTGDRCRFTLEEVKEKLRDLNTSVEIVSSEYKNTYGKLDCKCLKCGDIWTTTWASLKQGSECPDCAGVRKYTLDEVKAKLKIINPEIKIMSDEYINNKTKLKCQCDKCNHIWSVTWDSLSHSRSGCPKCNFSSKGEKNIEQWLKDKQIQYISEYSFNDCKGSKSSNRLSLCVRMVVVG